MVALGDRVRVLRRFQRSIRIDADLTDPKALTGYVCPPSVVSVLQSMAAHVDETQHTAFTWTGPYGAGKSSLAIALCALLGGKVECKDIAANALGDETSQLLWSALPPKPRGWRVLPVVARREKPALVFGEAIESARMVRRNEVSRWTDQAVIDTLSRIANRGPNQYGGLVVVIDEMGKFLEGAAYDGSDIYFFQQLAEIASRSKCRLLLVGVLHQAFEEYANRLSRDVRDEWAKVQGRFVDLAIQVGPIEQLELIGRAIDDRGAPREPTKVAAQVAAQMRHATPPQLLDNCWPLHPVTACLLGPISRRRFGQNQRSLFSFLSSSEPQGFQEFLQLADESDLYRPETVWDYLRSNLEPSIVASPDGHRWAMAVEALERCQGASDEDLQIRLLKVIALINLFKERSGLVASAALLNLAFFEHDEAEIQQALDSLLNASLVIFRKFDESYNVFEGSDFDIEHAVDEAYKARDEIDFSTLTALAGLQPMIAKRHYHDTGALRWFENEILPFRDISERISSKTTGNGAVGAFILAIPPPGESPEYVRTVVNSFSDQLPENIIVGVPRQSTWAIEGLARELLALEQVRDESLELRGDRVARLEIETRISEMQSRVERELRIAMDGAIWHARGKTPTQLRQAELNALASELSGDRYSRAPRIKNELLNRMRPSSNAIAARNALLRCMAVQAGEPRLGICGFPAEGGLFTSLLESTLLYRDSPDGFGFAAPMPDDDPCNLLPAWEAAKQLITANAHRTVAVQEIQEIWRLPPFGVKDGLLPVLSLAFIQSYSNNLALYRQGVFQVNLTDLDAEYLAMDAGDIQLRWMDMSNVPRELLMAMALVVERFRPLSNSADPKPIGVARDLISIYDEIAPWSQRTQRLSSNAKRVRLLFKQARDPNKLIFDDLPRGLSGVGELTSNEHINVIAANLIEAITELRGAYPAMLDHLKTLFLGELQIPNSSPLMLERLRERALNLLGASGNHRLEALLLRLARFCGTENEMESIASLAVNRPPQNWVDADIDRAALELAAMAQEFLHVESFVRVQGRRSNRHALAVIIGLGDDSTPLHEEFGIGETEIADVNDLIAQIDECLQVSGEYRRPVILAALAKLSARLIGSKKPGEAISTSAIKGAT